MSQIAYKYMFVLNLHRALGPEVSEGYVVPE
ncbi:hypothetical protein HKBW3S42_00596 [Candidatus Hakubella thermalkaliphila]|nr:hypothetical protein HKBW3S42_00596 [Candidatus Hakubella thermalkaliphila]GFP34374.1 hypothetical protein HKBW3S43_00168 [Candidatus Hakubella thermalkaliphila]